MRFLADQNVPRPSVQQLRASGLDVEWIGESAPGLPDQEVLALAAESDRILLTFDTDFGELIYRNCDHPPVAVVLLRFIPLTPLEPAELLLKIIREVGPVIAGHFTVVARDHVRYRPLPSSPK